jgi:hypothetical protein
VAYHPLNLALRLLLELAALAAIASYGWQLTDNRPLNMVAAVALPLIAATLWGVFAVPADPSRSGEAPVAVPGSVRLVLEFAIFGFATWSLYASGAQTLSLVLGAVVVVHYVSSYDRIRWLLGLE